MAISLLYDNKRGRIQKMFWIGSIRVSRYLYETKKLTDLKQRRLGSNESQNNFEFCNTVLITFPIKSTIISQSIVT